MCGQGLRPEGRYYIFLCLLFHRTAVIKLCELTEISALRIIYLKEAEHTVSKALFQFLIITYCSFWAKSIKHSK